MNISTDNSERKWCFFVLPWSVSEGFSLQTCLWERCCPLGGWHGAAAGRAEPPAAHTDLQTGKRKQAVRMAVGVMSACMHSGIWETHADRCMPIRCLCAVININLKTDINYGCSLCLCILHLCKCIKTIQSYNVQKRHLCLLLIGKGSMEITKRFLKPSISHDCPSLSCYFRNTPESVILINWDAQNFPLTLSKQMEHMPQENSDLLIPLVCKILKILIKFVFWVWV